MRDRVGPWLPAALWAAFLFVLSSRPVPGGPLPGQWDKVAHVAAYFILGALLAIATDRSGLSPLVAIGLGIAYGISDEFHQSFVPGRVVDGFDLLADTVGVIAGVLLYRYLRRWDSNAGPAPDKST